MRILVYDLVSENRKQIKGSEFEKKIRSVRVSATELLHSLGIQCTESVILISDDMAERTDDVIKYIDRMYSSVLSEAERALGIILPRPIIRLLTITQEQFITFRELAERRLREALDANIDRVSMISETSCEIEDSERARGLISSLRRLKREWLRIRDHVVSLGIKIEDDIDYLVQMIDSIVASIRGRQPWQALE